MLRLHTLCVLAALAAAPNLFSQAVNATLIGTVTDPSGALVPNAGVVATDAQTGVARHSITNESGNYSFPDLPPGSYIVTVEAQGFKKETRRDITVQVDTTTRADLRLTPGAVSETVEVTGAPPVLQTDSAGTGLKLDVIHDSTLPLISANRNFQSLLNIVPGVAPVAEQHSQFFNASSSLQTEVNGQMREGEQLHDRGHRRQRAYGPVADLHSTDRGHPDGGRFDNRPRSGNGPRPPARS